MTQEPLIRLLWQDENTLATAQRHLAAGEAVELQLPANYSHTLFVRLQPQAKPGLPEELDLTAAADLLERLSEIKGLEGLATLNTVIAGSAARIRILSPPPRILIEWPLSA